jgi:hypothetical protein
VTVGAVRALAVEIRPIPANEVASNKTIIKRSTEAFLIKPLLDIQTYYLDGSVAP